VSASCEGSTSPCAFCERSGMPGATTIGPLPLRDSGKGRIEFPRMAKRDYYEVLGVGRGASMEAIPKAYRNLAPHSHPTVNKSTDAGKRFGEVQEAYDVRNDEAKGRMYDQVGHAEPRMGGVGAGGPGGAHYTWNTGPGGRMDVDAEDLSSMFDAFFGGRGM